MCKETTLRLRHVIYTSIITAMLTGAVVIFVVLNEFRGNALNTLSCNQTTPEVAPVSQAQGQLPGHPAFNYWKGAYHSYINHGSKGHTARWCALSHSSIRQDDVIFYDNVTGEFRLRQAGFYDIRVKLYWRKANCLNTNASFLYYCLKVDRKYIDCRANSNKDRNASFTLSLISPGSEFYSANAKVKVVMNASGKCISIDAMMSNIEIIYRGVKTGP